jgi:hypothetical protein
MAHIKEPLEIDFFVEPQPLSESERKAVSEFIKKYKEKNKSGKKQKVGSKKKTTLTGAANS